LGNALYAGTLEFDLQSTPNANLIFNGTNGTFSFTPGTDFQINNVTGGTGSAMNLFGSISGTFTIGTITTSGGVSSAPVTGTGTLSISDGTDSLTATISFPPPGINKFGSIGMLNPTGAPNLSNVSYSGTNSDLKSFAGGLSPAGVLAFFNSHTLAQLAHGGSIVSTPFSGALTAVVPEPGTMVLALAAAPALGGFWVSRRRRKAAV
jgi:hypothetical protein